MPIRVNNPGATPDYGTVFRPLFFQITTSSAVYVAGRVMMQRIEFAQTTTISAVNIQNVATIAGNITVGIYAEGAANTPVGGAVVATSTSTAQAGASTMQSIPFTAPVTLQKGGYYVAVEFSDATATAVKGISYFLSPGQIFYYDRGGGYGALTTPCPASTTPLTTYPIVTVV